jgi:hypothetical protein
MTAPLEITVTNAGRAAIVNAQNTGTAPVTITQIGLSSTAVAPLPTATVLAGEFKRIASLAGEVVADDTIHITMTDESADAYTLRSLGLYLADGTLFAIYGQAGAVIEKTAQAIGAMSIDVIFANIAAAAITFGNANFTNPPATTERQGVVELSTLAEAQAGIDALRALTPAVAKAAILGWLLAQDGSGSGLDADMLDGQDSGYYTNITARLGYTPLNSTAYTAADVKAKLVTVDGSGSGVDADLLDGQDSSYYTNIPVRLGYTPVNRAGDTFSGRVIMNGNATGGASIASAASNLGEVEVKGNGAGAAMMTFHRPGSFAAYFGVDTDNVLAYGGWSLGASRYVIWHSGSDGSGSGLDADLLDGQDSSYYTNITARLGYTPVRQGGGSGQLGNTVYIGWSGSRMKMQVDASDLGNVVFDSNISDVWRASNDGSGSGMDADMVDGWHRDSIRDWNNLLNKPFNWAGQGGQPSWLWGGNAENQYYVYNPANFSVNYANSAGWAGSSGYADSAGKLSTASGSAPSYSARAWVNFNGVGAVSIRGAGNVSSITDNGVGNYSVNFSTAMPDGNYAAVGIVSAYSTRWDAHLVVPANSGVLPTTYCQVLTSYGGFDSVDLSYVSLVIHR